MMDGLLIIDKPAGITSHDVVNRVRRILGTRRVGHTGTLDPFATGVMVILVGKSTRLARFLDKDEKEYVATIRFGFETDTGDATGVRSSAECEMQNEEISEKLNSTDWHTLLARFRGKIEQVPPMYSAKKIAGKRLYESARRGIKIERKPQRVEIRKLEVKDDPALRTPHPALRIRVVCSAGTYIRSLAEDIGRAAGVGAHLTELRRTRSGRFHLRQAVGLDALADVADPTTALLPISAAVEHLAAFVLSSERVDATVHGLSTRVRDIRVVDGQNLRMVSPDRELIAIGAYSVETGEIKPKVVLV